MRKGILLAALCLPFLLGCDEEPGAGAVEKGLAPDFTLRLFDGGVFRLSEHRGGAVVVNFFASWCLTCGVEASDIEAAHKEFAARKVVFVGVAVQDTEEKAKEFATTHGYTFAAGLDEKGEIRQAYGVYGMPVTFVIDGKGVISRIRAGGITTAMLRNDLEKALE